MTTPAEKTLCDAVASEINASGIDLGIGIVAVSSYRPPSERAAFSDRKITAVPAARREQIVSRSQQQVDIDIDIAVQKEIAKKPDTDRESQIAAERGLVESIMNHLAFNSLADYSDATWIANANEPIYVPEHLDDRNIFTSVIRTTYRIYTT